MSAPLFSLTELTGREASAHRTVVIGTVEMNWRVWMVLVWTFPLSLIVAAVTWPILSTAAILMIPVVECAALYLIHRRTRSGLKLRTYQALWDRKRANTNQFFICGQPIDLSNGRWVNLMAASAPNPNYKGPVDSADSASPQGAPAHPISTVNQVVSSVAPTPQASVDDLFGAR